MLKILKATVNEEGKIPFRFKDEDDNTQGPWYIEVDKQLKYLHSDLVIRNRMSMYDHHGKKVWSGWYKTREEARKIVREYNTRKR